MFPENRTYGDTRMLTWLHRHHTHCLRLFHRACIVTRRNALGQANYPSPFPAPYSLVRLHSPTWIHGCGVISCYLILSSSINTYGKPICKVLKFRHRVCCLANKNPVHFIILERGIRFNLGLNTAKSANYIKKCFK